jgi:glycosyltransferase involved in cell wall biosynthesis
LQQRLDAATACHPESPTLNNFRVSPQLAIAESAALQQARRIITPHVDLLKLWPQKTQQLDWVLPESKVTVISQPKSKPVLLLPSASIGRKGIYELRSAIQDLNVHLLIAGGELEHPDFWCGYSVEYQPNFRQALHQADIVVAPAWVEHQPRRVLQAIAQGIPTICSSGCGLPELPGVIQVPIGDAVALREAIQALLGGAPMVAPQVAEVVP